MRLRVFNTLQPMSQSPPAQTMPCRLVAYFSSGEAMRGRSVADVVLHGRLDIPAAPPRLTADWQRESSSRIEPGDVDTLPLPRARARWPDYRHNVQAVSDWTRTLGLGGLLAHSEVALMACRGARYHHDGAQYGGAAFCNLFLGDDRGLDLHFPQTGLRIPLTRGTVVLFDTAQVHGVIQRGSSGFCAADFPTTQDHLQVFLSWELDIENTDLAQALRVRFDVHPQATVLPDVEQVWMNGAAASVCPQSGTWHPER